MRSQHRHLHKKRQKKNLNQIFVNHSFPHKKTKGIKGTEDANLFLDFEKLGRLWETLDPAQAWICFTTHFVFMFRLKKGRGCVAVG